MYWIALSATNNEFKEKYFILMFICNFVSKIFKKLNQIWIFFPDWLIELLLDEQERNLSSAISRNLTENISINIRLWFYRVDDRLIQSQPGKNCNFVFTRQDWPGLLSHVSPFTVYWWFPSKTKHKTEILRKARQERVRRLFPAGFLWEISI